MKRAGPGRRGSAVEEALALPPDVSDSSLPIDLQNLASRRLSMDHLRKRSNTHEAEDGLEPPGATEVEDFFSAVEKGAEQQHHDAAASIRRLSIDDHLQLPKSDGFHASSSSLASLGGGTGAPSTWRPDSRQERRSSIDQTIEALQQAQQRQQQQQQTPLVTPAPSASFNTVWQRRTDGQGWSMGTDVPSAAGAAASPTDAASAVGASSAANAKSEVPPNPNLPNQTLPTASAEGPAGCGSNGSGVPTASVAPPSGTHINVQAPSNLASILAAPMLAPASTPPPIPRMPRRRVTVLTHGAKPALLLHPTEPGGPSLYVPFVAIDTTGNGQADALVADSDGDGHADTLVLDTSADGVPDTAIPCVLVDTDGDGQARPTPADPHPIPPNPHALHPPALGWSLTASLCHVAPLSLRAMRPPHLSVSLSGRCHMALTLTLSLSCRCHMALTLTLSLLPACRVAGRCAPRRHDR